MYIPSVMAPEVGGCPSQYIDVISVVLEEWGAFVATTKAFNPPLLARKANLPVLLCSCWLFVKVVNLRVDQQTRYSSTSDDVEHAVVWYNHMCVCMYTMAVSGLRDFHDLAF